MANQNTPGSNPAFDSIYNPSGFDGQVKSDWMRLGGIPPANRKDLIDFSTADFDTFKTKFLDYIKAVYPNEFTNFYESDLGVMLTELYAYMGAVLSFKADAIAQENYLVTARTDESVTKLLELIGISMRGPVPAKAQGTLDVVESDFALTGTNYVTLQPGDRVFQTTSTRDSLPLTYTIYKVGANGNINMTDSNVQFGAAQSNAEGTQVSGVVLLEGQLQTASGTFKEIGGVQEISLPLPSVVEGSIFVSGSDGIYSEIESIWFASAGQMVFEKTYNEDFSCKLTFGDGNAGTSPLPGSTYICYYRTGGGQRGNIQPNLLNGTLNALYTDGTGTSATTLALTQTRAGTGGVDAESVEDAKRLGPMWFATQYRAVTGKDYTTFVNRFTSTAGKSGKGLAVLRDNGGAGNMIDIYVLQTATDVNLERASFEFKKELLDYLENYKMLTDEITVVDGIVRTLDIVATVFLDSSKKLSSDATRERVAGLIQDYFTTASLDFGTPLLLSELVAFILKDAGLRFFKIDNYADDIYVDFNEIIQLNNLELNVSFV